jgi:hypothetical protein
MKNLIGFVLLCMLFQSNLHAQSESVSADYNFPFIVTLQFHGFTVPFKNLNSNIRNVGIGIGTEVSLNDTHTWIQQVHAIWYRNKSIGNGLLFYSQNVWRPSYEETFAEVKLGAGYLYSFRPTPSFKSVNGQWTSVGKKGKGMLAVPLGVSIGSYSAVATTSLAPFVSYQFMVIKGYNTSIPIVPQTLLQAGALISDK